MQPLGTVTLRQSPLYVTAGVRFSPPTPVTWALAAKTVPRYAYGPSSNVTTVVETALRIVMFFESLLPSWLLSPANVAVAVQPLLDVTFVQSPP